MAKKNVGVSNARHSQLANKNAKKWLQAYPKKEAKRYETNRSYHESVIHSQNHHGRVLTAEERKRVYNAVKKNNGSPVHYYF